MKSSPLACACASLIATQAAAASPRLELSPTSKWDMDYGLERCSLARQFGSGDAAALLRIDSFGYWNEFRVLITGPAVPPFNTPAGSVFVTRTGDPEAVEAPSLQGKAGDHPAVSFSLDFAPYVSRETLKRLNKEERGRRELEMNRPRPEYDAAIDTISVRARGKTLLFKTGNLAAPLAAMRACVDDMYKSWGFDPAQQRALTRLAEPTIGTVRHVQADYPDSPLFRGASAYVPVRLTIDAMGRSSACVIQAEGVEKPFTDAVCQHLQGTFKPALDANGNPVSSVFHTSVVYLIGGYQ